MAPLLGPWMRNEALSDDPVLKIQTMWLIQRLIAPGMRELVRGLDESLDTVLIRIPAESVALLDGRGKSHRFPLNGKYRVLSSGAEARIRMSGDTLMIETVAMDWQQIETFELQTGQMVRNVELKSHQLPYVTVRTVYDRPRTALGHRSEVNGELDVRPATVRIVPPRRGHRELLSGRVGVQALVIDPTINAIEFLLDGKQTKRVRKRPFRARIALDAPPREQTLEVRAYGNHGEPVGTDSILLNRVDAPFSVRITGIRSARVGGDLTVQVEAAVSVPRSATLERVEFYRGEDLVSTVADFGVDAGLATARTIPIEALIKEPEPADFVRVTARLADGREREDAQLRQETEHQAEIEVQLVQIQVLVTDPDGNPVSNPRQEDFEILEDGERKPVANLHAADDVPLVLGLAIDSSDSMLRIWRQLNEVAGRFLANTLEVADRAFLVDFDDTVRLLQPLTGDKSLLTEGLGRLVPFGGTALNDGILFSLLQYRREPGRRALVVITDGADLHSRSTPSQSVDFAERLGLPIYFIELDQSPGRTEVNGAFPVSNLTAHPDQKTPARRLKRISRETGGRRFFVRLADDDPPWAERIEQVFDQIEEDLRHQHVLTYYSDMPPGTPIEPEIRMTRRDLKLRSAVPLEAIE